MAFLQSSRPTPKPGWNHGNAEHCKTINSPISNFCSLCGRPLDDQAAESFEDVKQWFMDHPEEVRQFFEMRVKKSP